MSEGPIYIGRPYLPPLQEFLPLLETIWETRILTNKGPFHVEFEEELCRYLQVEHISLLANGTLSLVAALRALQVEGEVITPPYSFVATSHALLWSGLTPVFVDIDRRTLNLDPDKIEAAITPRTSAILPVHCYGNPCAMAEIQAVAEKYNLKVIYDAAHAFGVRCNDESIFRFGDASIISFHATKVFNTFEGGAVVCPDAETKAYIDNFKNFGFRDETSVVAPGINGKMNEFSAALGVLQLRHIEEVLARRREIDGMYRQKLQDTKGLRFLDQFDHVLANHAYLPVFIEKEFPVSRDTLYFRLKEQGVFGRRYFYPLISNSPVYREFSSAEPANLPVANEIAEKVVCLPIHPELTDDELEKVVESVRNA